MYSNPSDHENSPHKGELANVEAMNWAWFSTINRVNSQVKKVSHASPHPNLPSDLDAD